MLDQLGAAELRATVHAYKEALAAHRETWQAYVSAVNAVLESGDA